MKKIKTKRRRRKADTPDPKKYARDFLEEAEAVRIMTTTVGWGVLKRDCENTLNELRRHWAYMDENSPEYKEARIIAVACDKIIKMVEDYEENAKTVKEFLNKITNPKNNILLDYDGE